MEPADLLVLRNYVQTMADGPSEAKQDDETAQVKVILMICSCLQQRNRQEGWWWWWWGGDLAGRLC